MCVGASVCVCAVAYKFISSFFLLSCRSCTHFSAFSFCCLALTGAHQMQLPSLNPCPAPVPLSPLVGLIGRRRICKQYKPEKRTEKASNCSRNNKNKTTREAGKLRPLENALYGISISFVGLRPMKYARSYLRHK